MEKALTLNELIADLQSVLKEKPETGDKPVVFLDWNSVSTKVSEGVYDFWRDKDGNIETVVLG